MAQFARIGQLSKIVLWISKLSRSQPRLCLNFSRKLLWAYTQGRHQQWLIGKGFSSIV